MKHGLQARNWQDPEIIYVDNAKQDKPMLERIFPSLTNGITRVSRTRGTPARASIPASHDIFTAESYGTADEALEYFDQALDDLCSDNKLVLGLDCEWNRHKENPREVDLVQIGDESRTILLRLNLIGKVPSRLVQLLMCSRVVIVGSYVSGDIKRIMYCAHRDRLVEDIDQAFAQVQHCNIGQLARRVNAAPTAQISLKELAKVVLNVDLPKDEDVRLSGWDTPYPFCLRQKQYAVMDCLFGRRIYIKLKTMEDNGERFEEVSPQDDDSPVDPDASAAQPSSRVLQDVFHCQQQILRTLPAKHSLLKPFSRELSEAFFVEDAADVQAVKDWLSTRDESLEQLRLRSPDWLWRHVRRTVPLPIELERRLLAVIDRYKSNAEFFRPPTAKQFEAVIEQARAGLLSDPPGHALYMKDGETRVTSDYPL